MQFGKFFTVAIASFGAIAFTVAAQTGVPYSFEFKGEKIYGSRELTGYNIAGTYMYDNFGKLAEPRVELRADGTGCWANHGRACKAVEWWLEADQTGKTKAKVYEGRTYAAIFFKHLEDADAKKAGDYSGQTLMIDPVKRQIIIAGERVKSM